MLFSLTQRTFGCCTTGSVRLSTLMSNFDESSRFQVVNNVAVDLRAESQGFRDVNHTANVKVLSFFFADL